MVFGSSRECFHTVEWGLVLFWAVSSLLGQLFACYRFHVEVAFVGAAFRRWCVLVDLTETVILLYNVVGNFFSEIHWFCFEHVFELVFSRHGVGAVDNWRDLLSRVLFIFLCSEINQVSRFWFLVVHYKKFVEVALVAFLDRFDSVLCVCCGYCRPLIPSFFELLWGMEAMLW